MAKSNGVEKLGRSPNLRKVRVRMAEFSNFQTSVPVIECATNPRHSVQARQGKQSDVPRTCTQTLLLYRIAERDTGRLKRVKFCLTIVQRHLLHRIITSIIHRYNETIEIYYFIASRQYIKYWNNPLSRLQLRRISPVRPSIHIRCV